ncbi:protein POF1B isoform 1-T1 [Menidia menidia]
MSYNTNQKTTTRTYRTVNVAPQEQVTTAVAPLSPVTQVSAVPYAMNGSYETMRYLMPVQQAAQQPSLVLMQQPMMQQPMIQQSMIQQPMMQQMMYVQTLPRVSIGSQGSEVLYHMQNAVESVSEKSSSVFSQSSSPMKSPVPAFEEEEEVEEEVEEEEEEVDGEVEIEEVEIVNVIQQKPSQTFERVVEIENRRRDLHDVTKMDTRYFGELLADVYRKNCDIHSCISEHVSRIRGQKHLLDSNNDYKVEKEDVEGLIPKGASELTKQQIRYLLQTRLTADKSMRLLLSTFHSLREELLQMSEDLRRLESDKESLERDLTFKADQAKQYDSLLEAVRDNNRQLQLSLKEAVSTQRSLENQLLSGRNTDSKREFKIKELEGRMRAMEKENEMLRQKLSGQSSSTTLHIKTEELSRQYNEQLSAMQQEKDQEIQRLRSQIIKIQSEVSITKTSSAEKSLQLKISELLSTLEKRQTTITRQEEEIRRLMTERSDSSKNVTKTIITKRYRNQYPILGLLGDDYQATSPVKEAKTIVIERTGEIIKQEIITTP